MNYYYNTAEWICTHATVVGRQTQTQYQTVIFMWLAVEPWRVGTTRVKPGNKRFVVVFWSPTCSRAPVARWICPCRCSCALGCVWRCSPASCSLWFSRKNTPSCTGCNHSRKKNTKTKHVTSRCKDRVTLYLKSCFFLLSELMILVVVFKKIHSEWCFHPASFKTAIQL